MASVADRAAFLPYGISSTKLTLCHANEIDCMANVIDFNMKISSSRMILSWP